MELQQTVPIKVLLVDDHEHVLWGLGKLIEGEEPRMVVAGTARTVAEALAVIRERKPDVVLLDIFLGEVNSLDYLPQFLDTEGLTVLVLTGAGDAELHRRAVERGASRVITKGAPAEVLLSEIERAYQVRNERRLAR
jgi:two-component system, NarL family, nitrate/nitrite response regulator NarL